MEELTTIRIVVVKKVAENLTIPILVGGGIRTQKQLDDAYKNGADVVVIGSAFEENIEICIKNRISAHIFYKFTI